MTVHARRIMPDDALAEDAVSETFIKIMNHREKLFNLECHQIKAYIVNIVHTTCYDILKKRNRYPHESDDDLEYLPDERVNILIDITSEESYQTIITEFEKLPDKLRDVAHRYLALEMSHEEIANELGITVATSKKRLSRAKTIIKENLGGGNHAT